MKVGLHINVDKTKFLALNQQNIPILTTMVGRNLERVSDYKYLGSWMGSTEKDVKIRKALPWKASDKLSKIWKYNSKRPIKVRVFKAMVEVVLLYGCESWTLTKRLEKQLDGCYMRLLRTTLNINWKEHLSNAVLYLGLQRISDLMRQRRLRFAGHWFSQR